MIFFLTCLISLFTTITFFELILFKKIKLNVMNILLLFFIILLLYVINTTVGNYVKFLMMFFLYCFILLVFFKQDLKNQIILSLFYTLLIVIVDSILTFYILFLYYNCNDILMNYMGVFNIFNAFLQFLIIYTLLKMRSSRYIILNIIKGIFRFKFYKFFLSFIYYTSLVIIIIYVIVESNDINYSSMILSIGIYVFSLMYLHYKYEFVARERDYLQKKNISYLELLDETSTYKHNVKNKLLVIKSISNKRTSHLIDELFDLESIINVNQIQVSNIPKEISNFFYEKIVGFDYVIFRIDNKLSLNIKKMITLNNFLHYVECIGICLDNSIEATQNVENPFIRILFYDDEKYIYTHICNNFSDNIDVDKLNTKKYSTKNRNSGFGLTSLSKKSNIDFDIHIKENVFCARLRILKK